MKLTLASLNPPVSQSPKTQNKYRAALFTPTFGEKEPLKKKSAPMSIWAATRLFTIWNSTPKTQQTDRLRKNIVEMLQKILN